MKRPQKCQRCGITVHPHNALAGRDDLHAGEHCIDLLRREVDNLRAELGRIADMTQGPQDADPAARMGQAARDALRRDDAYRDA